MATCFWSNVRSSFELCTNVRADISRWNLGSWTDSDCELAFGNLGGNSQNFLSKFVRFLVTLRCFYRVENRYFMIYTVVNTAL